MPRVSVAGPTDDGEGGIDEADDKDTADGSSNEATANDDRQIHNVHQLWLNMGTGPTIRSVPTFNRLQTGMRGILRTLGNAPVLTMESEERLIGSAQAGDTASFELLQRRLDPSLRRFVSKRVRVDYVDDVVQDTWIAAWANLGHFTIRARFRTWLFAIAANKCRDLHRKVVPAELDCDAPCEEPEYARLELRHAVGIVLDQLTPVHRELLDLYYFDEMNLPEIAMITGKNLNTVKYQFYRAHKEFAVLMEESNA